MAASPSHPLPFQSGSKHIVVCGGGVIGACTAYFLSQNQKPPTSVTVVEKSSPACPASGKAGGFLALDWCDGGPMSSLARASFRLHKSLSQKLNGEEVYGYRAVTTLSVPVLSERVASSSASLRGSNLLPDWVDGETARPAKQIGTTETTAQVHPRLFTQTLLSASEAKVIKGEVETIIVENGHATGVVLKGNKEVIPADAVVLALGPWSNRLSPISELFSVSGLKAHSIVLRPAEPDKITPHALFLSYQPAPGAKMLDPEVYPRPTGEVYICGMSKDAEVPEDPESITGETESIEMLHKIAGTVSSHLKRDTAAEVIAEQACFLPCTDDGLPVIGELPGVKNCYVATGHSCWGILNGPATGASLAELILEGKSTTVDLKPFTPARFVNRRTRLGV
ncbi:D-amino acid dehydrogenase [Rhynchospora pubera]|uniref:D-amino acid dehydrogenase n=1 Tax=Rhynchospora pubera TaxID=906938 RepID=A0AAV8H0F0_9POAL|nr:D-amino acid dehydrogenase [Rhynchospora pubera]